MPNEAQSYPCPCCGYLTLSESPPGTFEVCPVCFWEDDNLQFADPSCREGANQVSLEEAQKNFKQFGAVAEEFTSLARPPQPKEIPSRSNYQH